MKTIFPCLVLASAVAACATPQVAMDQAKNTVGLMAGLSDSIDDFNAIQNATAKISLDSIADQEREVSNALGFVLLTETKRSVAGNTASRDTQEALAAMADAFATKAKLEAGREHNLQSDLASLLKPLPVTKGKMLVAQKAVAEMGTELSPTVRAGEFQAFYATVKQGVADNKKKIKEAEQAAANKPKPQP